MRHSWGKAALTVVSAAAFSLRRRNDGTAPAREKRNGNLNERNNKKVQSLYFDPDKTYINLLNVADFSVSRLKKKKNHKISLRCPTL